MYTCTVCIPWYILICYVDTVSGIGALRLVAHLAHGDARGNSAAHGDGLTVPEPAIPIDTDLGQRAIGVLSADSTLNWSGTHAPMSVDPQPLRFFCSIPGADRSLSV